MNSLAWLSPALASQGAEIPPGFSRWLASGNQEFGLWYLLAERSAAANRTKLGQLYPTRDILPFARRTDRDDVACWVCQDPDHSRGSVVVVHDESTPGDEVEQVFQSLADRWKQARNEA